MKLRSVAAAWAAALTCAVSFAQAHPGEAQPAQAHPGEAQPSPGAWAAKSYRWSYNPSAHPAWLSADEAKQQLLDAAHEWETCGIRMEFAGETDRSPGAMDGTNVVGWRQDLPGQVRGITQGRSAKGQLIERDIAFSASRREFQRFPVLLRKVMVHEFGHAIGLTHAATCSDVMTLAADCPRANPLTLPTKPTAHDLERCRALYSSVRD